MYRISFRQRPGFTVAELLIASALVSVLMGAILVAFVIGLRIWETEITRAAFIKDISYSMQVMSEDLRQATSFVATTNRNRVSFLIPDVNGDGSPETIRYNVSRGNLRRTQNGAATPVLARNVQSVTFRYYRPNDNVNPMGRVVRSQIRVVEIDLVLADGNESIQFTTRVRPRGI
ncbi:MAG: hypothetical protein PHR22_03980 [Candidatus Omnitrophica bacterium]|nr:hypothetical protein [Candidatus Omnitrophota bacterium]